MDSKQRKNNTRRRLTATSKHDKFISTYFKIKYPQIYCEADHHYTELNERYPQKRDLRKTVEFLHITGDAYDFKELYYRNKLSKRTQQNPNNDNMVLRIPLLDNNVLPTIPEVNVHATTAIPEVNVHATTAIPEVNVHATTAIPEVNVHATTAISEVNVHATTAIPEVNVHATTTISEVNVHATTAIPEVNVHATTAIPEKVNEAPLVIPDHVYEDLLQQLSNDPDLRAIFDDMNDINLCEDHQPIDEVENIIDDLCQNPDEPTSLEQELYTLGW